VKNFQDHVQLKKKKYLTRFSCWTVGYWQTQNDVRLPIGGKVLSCETPYVCIQFRTISATIFPVILVQHTILAFILSTFFNVWLAEISFCS
jgi:hypothetical protein